jgi:thiol-disulfide isomerase/thioredoxin
VTSALGSPTPRQSAAPELRGRAWLNTGGRELTLGDFRGRFLLLDFWTFCCVNCLHVLEELRPLEERYDGELVVVGVHSPKFEHEADAEALTAAVERYQVRHPVLDDPELVTWRAYTARAWPTLVLVDPQGYVAAQFAGEGHAHAIDALVGSCAWSTTPEAPCSREAHRTLHPPASRTTSASRRRRFVFLARDFSLPTRDTTSS